MSTDKPMPEEMDLQSMDISAENRAKLKALFPSVFTETVNDKGELVESIDFEKLKAELGTFSDLFESRRERFGLDWPGKKDCMKLIQEPSRATLKPARDESVNFDGTENLFIEGDNLEVLKLLQKSYYGKVKMIYIDPPYNTGKEFIYPDKYSESLETYLEYAGLVDGEGRKFSTNTPNEGRFHTKWLNMMYPRLYLARNLLREDGVIFISIDDNEVANLRKICDEIFGEENFEGHIHWRRRHNQPNDKTKMIGLVAEHIIAYSKNKPFLKASGVGKIGLTGTFSNPDNDPRGDWASKPWKVGSDQSGSRYIITTPTGKIYDEEWMGEESTFKELLADNRIIFPNNGDGAPRKKYFKFEREQEGQCATNWWPHDQFGHNQGASNELTELMGEKNVFSNPKPSELIKNLISIANCKQGDIVLDFFAGSCATFHAALKYEDRIRVICVQLPEPLDQNIKDQRIGYEFCQKNGLPPNIASIGKERIRRVIKKIEEERAAKANESANALPGMAEEMPELDLGFKVLKLDRSNFKPWEKLDADAPEEEISKAIQQHLFHIDPGASQEDILYEILLKAGFMPTEKVEKLELAGKTVFSIADGALLICLEDEITRELIDAVAEAEPMQFICLDQGFKGNDQLKANAVQTFAARNQGRDKAGQIVFRTV